MFHTHFRNGCRRRSGIQQSSADEEHEDDDELLNMPVPNTPIRQLNVAAITTSINPYEGKEDRPGVCEPMYVLPFILDTAMV